MSYEDMQRSQDCRRYHTLTLPEDEAANCIYVNNTLVHTHSTEAPLSAQVTAIGKTKPETILAGFQGEN